MSARQPFLSVIISTRNRKERLRQCLSSLTAQSYPRDRWELIVVEDGDQEPLDEVMLSLRDRLPLRWFRVSHAGCGVAKNAGGCQARSVITIQLESRAKRRTLKRGVVYAKDALQRRRVHGREAFRRWGSLGTAAAGGVRRLSEIVELRI